MSQQHCCQVFLKLNPEKIPPLRGKIPLLFYDDSATFIKCSSSKKTAEVIFENLMAVILRHFIMKKCLQITAKIFFMCKMSFASQKQIPLLFTKLGGGPPPTFFRLVLLFSATFEKSSVYSAIWQQCLAEWSQGGGGPGLYFPGTPSDHPHSPRRLVVGYICGVWVLPGWYTSQSKPNSSSLYTLFSSVIYNSVIVLHNTGSRFISNLHRLKSGKWGSYI